MLAKQAIVTVIPAVAGQPFIAASLVCTVAPPVTNTGGSTTPPTTSSSSGGAVGVVPSTGTPIVLEAKDGMGGYVASTSTAPAPAGYVCRYEAVFITDYADPLHPAVLYNVVCTQS